MSDEKQAVLIEQYLRDLYFIPQSPVAYSSGNKIYKQIREDKKFKETHDEVKKFLANLSTFQLHKPVTSKFIFRKTMVSYIDQQWQADLVEMQKFEKFNKGNRYILTVIEIFSRYAWALPIKSKRGDDVSDVFEIIFREAAPEKFNLMKAKNFTINHLRNF